MVTEPINQSEKDSLSIPGAGSVATGSKRTKPTLLMALQLKKSLSLMKNEEAPASPMIPAATYLPNRVEIVNYYETQVTEFTNVLLGAYSFSTFVPEFKGQNEISNDWDSKMKILIHDCCINYDFTDKNRTQDIEKKRSNLYEIFETLQKSRVLSSNQIRDVFVMLKYNLVRNFFDRTDEDLIEDEDNIHDIAWTQIWVSYQILTEMCYVKNTEDLKNHLSNSFVDQIMYNLKSLDKRERTMIVEVIQIMYENFSFVRNQVERTTQNIFTSIIYEGFRFIGTKELLTIALSFPVVSLDRLNPERSSFLFKTLMPLHGYRKITQCLDQLIDLLLVYVQDDENYLVPLINKIARFSKIQSIDEQRGFIVETEEMLKRCNEKKIKELEDYVFMKILKCLTSYNKDTVSECVKLLNSSKLAARIKASDELRAKALKNVQWIKSFHRKLDCMSELASFQKKISIKIGTLRRFSFNPNKANELGVQSNPLRNAKSSSMILLNRSHLEIPSGDADSKSEEKLGEKKTKFKVAINALNALKRMIKK